MSESMSQDEKYKALESYEDKGAKPKKLNLLKKVRQLKVDLSAIKANASTQEQALNYTLDADELRKKLNTILKRSKSCSECRSVEFAQEPSYKDVKSADFEQRNREFHKNEYTVARSLSVGSSVTENLPGKMDTLTIN